jgi:serine/threonine-protein kinase
MGTVGYMSPEQLKGSSRIDHRTDIYSLGCVIVHMVTGAPPVPGLIADVPPAVQRLLARCLASNPDDRFPTMRDLHTACDAVIAELAAAPTAATRRSVVRPAPAEMPTTLRSSAGEVAPSPAGRLRRAPLASGAIAVVAGALTALFTVSRQPREASEPGPVIQMPVAMPAAAPGTRDVSVPRIAEPSPPPTQSPTPSPPAPELAPSPLPAAIRALAPAMHRPARHNFTEVKHNASETKHKVVEDKHNAFEDKHNATEDKHDTTDDADHSTEDADHSTDDMYKRRN